MKIIKQFSSGLISYGLRSDGQLCYKTIQHQKWKEYGYYSTLYIPFSDMRKIIKTFEPLLIFL
jgi:hypothetical protein